MKNFKQFIFEICGCKSALGQMEGFFTDPLVAGDNSSHVLRILFSLEKDHPGRHRSFMYHFGRLSPSDIKKKDVRNWVEKHLKSLIHRNMGDVNWEMVHRGVIEWAEKKSLSSM